MFVCEVEFVVYRIGIKILYLLVASLEGFEPTTRCLEGSRSVQLSYRDKLSITQM